MARNKQLTVGELEHYLSLIKNKDIKVCVGVGEGEYPLCFLLNSRGDLLLHTSLYQQEQDDNLNEVLSLNIITKNNGN
jgi:hypothetical protein